MISKEILLLEIENIRQISIRPILQLLAYIYIIPNLADVSTSYQISFESDRDL